LTTQQPRTAHQGSAVVLITHPPYPTGTWDFISIFSSAH